MLHFMMDMFQFEGRAQTCDMQSEECQVKVTMPVCDGAVEDVYIERCILPEVQALWKMGIKTHCSCCGHGVPYNAFITVEKEFKDQMDALGYESPPDLLEVCENCNVRIMHTPKSVLTEEMYEKG